MGEELRAMPYRHHSRHQQNFGFLGAQDNGAWEELLLNFQYLSSMDQTKRHSTAHTLGLVDRVFLRFILLAALRYGCSFFWSQLGI